MGTKGAFGKGCIVQLKKAWRGEWGKGKEFRKKKSRDTGDVFFPHAFLFLLGLANFWPRLQERRGKRWSVRSFGSEQEEPAQGEEREMLPPRTAGLGVFCPPQLPCPHPIPIQI